LYWNAKIETFMGESQKGVEALDHEQSQKIKALHNHIDEYVPMNYINAERRLCS
jgi:hypothetical protein